MPDKRAQKIHAKKLRRLAKRRVDKALHTGSRHALQKACRGKISA